MAESSAASPANIPPGLNSSQWEAIKRLRPKKEMPVPTVQDSRPASIYTSDERFEQERIGLFSRAPVIVAPSAFLPEPNTAVAMDGYRIPMIVSRDSEGVAHAFINACRHKGAKLLENCEPVKNARITCPYHAWSYGFDGALMGIPRHEVFPSLDKAALGLVPLSTFEGGGMIWVGLDHKAPPAELEGTDQIIADFDAFGLVDMYVYGRRSYELKANWKAVMEPFLEPYHIHRLHADSIANMFVDGSNINTHFGHFLRQTSGKEVFDPSVLAEGVSNIHKYITHAYLVFPNTMVITSPYYMSVMILMPQAAAHTRVDYYMLLDRKPDNPKAEDIASRSYQIIHEVFGGEDFKAAELCQEGLSSGAVEEVHYGGLEEMIGPFHESIESFLAAR
jgi:phenylpropionate dioxygenase-like ring-hydroxylating dioxygenase large terminal subunit